MGDGRYYTIYQFTTTLIFIILTILTVVFMIINYYKYKNKENGIYISISFLLLLLCIIVSFAGNLIGDINQALILRSISTLLFIAYLNIFTMYLFSCIIELNKFRIKESVIFIIMISIITVITKGKFLIADCEFWSVRYSIFYIGFLLMVCLYIATSIYKMLRSKSHLHSLYSKNKLAVVFLMWYLVPIVLYLIVIINEYRYLDIVHCILYFVLIIFINVVTATAQSFGLTSKQFEEISDIMEYYVFVIDNKGNIVYKNDAFKNAVIFNDVNNVDINNLNLLFSKNVKIVKNDKGNRYIQLELEEKIEYYSYKNKELKDEEKLLGYMVIINNITDILALIKQLEINNKKYIETNKRLSNYSDVVYQLEKEKEISKLLEEIITTREKSMSDLALMIDDIESNLHNEEFQLKLNKAISLNIDILSGVRHAVTAYREYYGGNR